MSYFDWHFASLFFCIYTNLIFFRRHIHDRAHRKRDTTKCFNQREVTRKRDRQTGLNTLKYSIVDTKSLTIDAAKLTVLNIKLTCDRTQTPWCDCDGTADTVGKE